MKLILTLHLNEGPDPTVHLEGELDAAGLDALRELLARVPRQTRLCIDLRGLAFIDSSGLGLLVKTSQWLRASGGGMMVRDPSPAVRRAIDYAGLTGHFGLTV